MTTVDARQSGLDDLGRSIHSCSVVDVYRLLEMRSDGLTAAEADERLARFGPNVIREAKRQPLVLKLLANFTHLMAVLLWIGPWTNEMMMANAKNSHSDVIWKASNVTKA